MLSLRRHPEAGSALIGAIAILVIASFVIVAIMVSSRASSDGARTRLENAASEQLARDAGTALAASYSVLASGEFDGYVPSEGVLRYHASRLPGGDVIPNSHPAAAAAGPIDNTNVPSNRRFTVVQSLQDGRRGFWQVFSAGIPEWGSTKGGRVSIYLRTWTDNGAPSGATQPMLYRLELRPSWFADYQMLFDGPLWFGGNAQINGRIHTNGYETSFFDQYRSLVNAGTSIRIDGSGCGGRARITSARGGIDAPGNCAGQTDQNTKDSINLLRARDLAAQILRVCNLPAADRARLDVACPPPGDRTVSLSGTTVNYSGGSLDAGVSATHEGAVLLVRGNVRISGHLADNARARALVFAASSTTAGTNLDGNSITATITSNGAFGSSTDQSNLGSSFGLVSDGDIIIEQDSGPGCSTTLRGAFVTTTGMLSIRQETRVPLAIGNGPMCGGEARIHGSMSGHLPPVMISSANNAGFANREYEALPALYDNPPPLFPTASDWMVVRFAPANIDCFTEAGGTYTLTSSNCV